MNFKKLALSSMIILASQGVLADNGHGSNGMVADVKVDRTINVDAGDLFFSKDKIRVAKGETVRFVVTNKGSLEHEFVIGSMHEQNEHRKMMMDAAASGQKMNHGSKGHGAKHRQEDQEQAAMTMQKSTDKNGMEMDSSAASDSGSGMNMQKGQGSTDMGQGNMKSEVDDSSGDHSGMNMQSSQSSMAPHSKGHGEAESGVATPADMPSLTLEPGETKNLMVTFPEGADNLEFACNIPGHYQAGMHGRLTIK